MPFGASQSPHGIQAPKQSNPQALSSLLGHGFPVLTACLVTLNIRTWRALESQALQSSQLPTQSNPHFLSSLVGGHGFPLLTACLVTMKFRTWRPLESQALQSSQLPTQSKSHGFVSGLFGHCLPFPSACCCISKSSNLCARVRVAGTPRSPCDDTVLSTNLRKRKFYLARLCQLIANALTYDELLWIVDIIHDIRALRITRWTATLNTITLRSGLAHCDGLPV